jgi:tetratricopeptide (TPR) repeat protein
VDVEVADLRLLRELASTIDEPDRARTLLAECIERADALGSRFPDRPDVLEARANAYFFAALVAGPKEALRLWGDSNRVFQQLADRAPGDLTHLRSLALTEKYIGAEHHAAKRLDQARTHYERALELDRLIQQAKPEDRQTASDLAFDLGNVASIARESEPPDLARATSLYRESLLLRERVAALDSRDVFARQAVGYCLLQLSNLSRVRGDIREAVEYGRRSVAAYESLPPSTALVRRGYAWLALGRAHTAAGHHEDGCVALRRAREVFTLVQTSPRDRALLEADTPAFVSRALEACRPRP